MAEIQRIFLIGCPRSGTTLVQSMLAANTEVFTLPETHFFSRIIPSMKWTRRFDLTDRTVRRFLESKLSELPGETPSKPALPAAFFISSFGKAFAKRMDRQAALHGKDAWVEKTPQHLHRIRQISKGIPTAKFIHIVRDGRDTIASLYHVTQEYSDQWGGAQSLQNCIDRWISDIGVSRRYADNPRHCTLIYDELLADPARVLRSLCSFIGIPFQASMIGDFSRAYRDRVAEKNANWTGNAGKPLARKQDDRKYDTYLDEEQREVITASLTAAGLTQLADVFPTAEA